MDTLEFLNNYGRNKVSADFSGDESLLEPEEYSLCRIVVLIRQVIHTLLLAMLYG